MGRGNRYTIYNLRFSLSLWLKTSFHFFNRVKISSMSLHECGVNSVLCNETNNRGISQFNCDHSNTSFKFESRLLFIKHNKSLRVSPWNSLQNLTSY